MGYADHFYSYKETYFRDMGVLNGTVSHACLRKSGAPAFLNPFQKPYPGWFWEDAASTLLDSGWVSTEKKAHIKGYSQNGK